MKDEVFGFVHELISPIKEKYELAVHVALKSKMNLFVVDT